MFAVYTISREYGSGGSTLAIKMSEISGYQLIWRELINQAAIQIGAPDMALAVIDELGFFGLCPDDQTCEKFKVSLEKVVKEKAKSGNVIIVGRASQIILNEFPNCCHIRVMASLKTRIKNIQRTKKVSESGARAQIQESDRSRQQFIKKMYGVDWNNPSLYDLTINMDKYIPDQIAPWLLQLLGQDERRFF
jgi:cytidylate kinase